MIHKLREWDTEDRRSVQWLAALPAVGSALFTIMAFPMKPSLWAPGFVITSIVAYATAFVGVIPALFAFRHKGWTRVPHYAIAGLIGVLLPWLVIGICSEPISQGNVRAEIGEALLCASAIGAAMAAFYGWQQRRAVIIGAAANRKQGATIGPYTSHEHTLDLRSRRIPNTQPPL